jgi:uncharacterized protein involved in exopolysaccharide biosynthesis
MLGALSSTDSSPERGRLEANLAQYRATYADLLKSYENIRVAEAQEANSLTVVNPPEVPTEPVGPRTTTNTLLAAFLSAGLALTVRKTWLPVNCQRWVVFR